MFSQKLGNGKYQLEVPLLTRRALALPAIMLDRNSRRPLHDQISRQIAQAIRDGGLEKDVRLPSSRMMAKLLGVSRNTVLTAYENLVAADSITGKPGAGMRVNNGPGHLGLHAAALRYLIRDACYPAKILSFADPDGNPLYLNF